MWKTYMPNNFKSAHGTFTKTVHMVGKKASLNTL